MSGRAQASRDTQAPIIAVRDVSSLIARRYLHRRRTHVGGRKRCSYWVIVDLNPRML